MQHCYKQIYGFDTNMENNTVINNIEQIEKIIDNEIDFSNFNLYCDEEELTKEIIYNKNNLKI